MQEFKSKYLYFIIFVLSTLVVVLIAHKGEIGQRDIANSLLALFGTFLGATFAFRLNEDKENRKIQLERISSLNRALFILVRQHNAIRSYKKEIDNFPEGFIRAFNFPAMKLPSYEDLTHNTKDLEFLVEILPDILFQLTIEQERFQQAMEAIKIRNEFYVNEVQPSIEKRGLNNKTISQETAARELGDRIYFGAMNGMEVATNHINESEISISNMHKKLHKLAKDLYPDKKFIVYE